MSIAFSVKENKFEVTERSDEPDLEIRTITKIERLYDVSAVDIPAYDTTSISARKAFNAESKEREAESLRNAKELELEKAKYDYLEVKK